MNPNSLLFRSRLVATCGITLMMALGLVSFARAGDDGKQIDTRADAPTAASPLDSAAPLKALEPYLGGEWKIDGKWTDGNPLRARETFEWGIGRKFIVCKTYVTKADGSEYQRYETFFGVKDGKLTAWGFTFDGKAETSDYTVEGNKLSSSRPMKAADGSTGTLHQSIELVEPNRMRWLVSFEKDGKTQQLMDGFWVREASAAAK